MRTARTWKTHAGRALAIGAMLLSPAFVVGQEQDRQSEAGPTHRGQVAAIENGTLVMTIDGAQRHTHEVPDNAKVTINGEPADLQDLRPGDRIEVRTEKGNPDVALLIAATRQEDAREQQQRDRGEARRTFRQGDDQQQRRDRDRGQDRGQADEQRAWLGVLLAPDEQGIRVVQVYPGSPADRAGIRPGDLLVGTDGQEFNAPEDVSQAIADEQPGATARFTIERQGSEEEIEVELGRRPRAAERGMPGLPGGPDMGGMMREFRGFGPDRQMMQEHRRIQQEHQQLKEQVGELQRELRELRRELNQLRQQRQNGGNENSAENP